MLITYTSVEVGGSVLHNNDTQQVRTQKTLSKVIQNTNTSTTLTKPSQPQPA